MKKAIKLITSSSLILLLAKGLDNRLQTSYYSVPSKKIPEAFDGFKIAHISDYHNDPQPGLISEIKHEAPDIIVMTGDMTDDKDGSYLPALELIKKVLKIAPCYIVSGNHDTWRHDYSEFVSNCKKAGAIFLQNESTSIEKDNSRIIISGMEDTFTKVRMKQIIKKYLNFFKISEEYQILLFHRANGLDFLKDFGFDLILSGHLHGGQVRIPGIGGLCSPLSSLGESGKIFFPKYFGGMYKSNNSVMIVNRGIGNPMPIPRIFNRPELGIITLNKTEE